MQFNKTNFALAAGFTGIIISLVSHLLMCFTMGGGIMGMRSGMGMGMMRSMECPIGMGIIIWPLYSFIVTAITGWLFAFFYNMLEQRSSLR